MNIRDNNPVRKRDSNPVGKGRETQEQNQRGREKLPHPLPGPASLICRSAGGRNDRCCYLIKTIFFVAIVPLSDRN